MLRWPSVLTLLVCVATCLGCGSGESDRADGQSQMPMVAPMEVPNPSLPGSSGSTLTLGDDGILYLSWIEPRGEGHRLRVASWVGDEWSGGQTVAEGDEWFVNWADFPAVAALEDGTLAAHWLAMRGDGTYAYGVRLSVSPDRGVTWSDPVWAHSDDTPTEHGFVSLVPWGADGFRVVWLDGRETGVGHDGDSHDNPEGQNDAEGHDVGGPMTLRTAFLSRTGEVSGETLIDDRVCDCCGTDAVRFGDGLFTAFRDRSEKEIRDIGYSWDRGSGWSDPSLVHADGWHIPGCPVNGPALAVAEGKLGCVWFTMPGESNGEVRFAAFDGKRFGDPVRIDDGDPLGRVDLLERTGGGFVALWMEAVGDTAEIRYRSIHRGKAGTPQLATQTSATRSSGFPRAAVFEGRIFLTRTEVGDSSRVVTSILGMP